MRRAITFQQQARVIVEMLRELDRKEIEEERKKKEKKKKKGRKE